MDWLLIMVLYTSNSSTAYQLVTVPVPSESVCRDVARKIDAMWPKSLRESSCVRIRTQGQAGKEGA